MPSAAQAAQVVSQVLGDSLLAMVASPVGNDDRQAFDQAL
jgi:hypothetical protein